MPKWRGSSLVGITTSAGGPARLEPEQRFTICTSHVERNNLSIRTFMKRFTRLSLGFSEKLTNLRAAVALHVFHYNFCRIHGSLKRTPAMAAGVTDRLWSLEICSAERPRNGEPR